MFKALKKIFVAEVPSIITEVEHELREAEREYLIVATKVEYYIALSECHDARIRRLRLTLKTQDILQLPEYDDEAPCPARIH